MAGLHVPRTEILNFFLTSHIDFLFVYGRSGDEYILLLKTGSLDNAIREFPLAKPSWYMSHYTMIYKNGERMRDFLGLFVFIVVQFSIFWGRF